MADSTRELDHIKEDIRVLHERSQYNKLKLAAKEIHRLSDLATQGKTSLKTLLWVGSLVAGLGTLIYTLITIFPK